MTSNDNTAPDPIRGSLEAWTLTGTKLVEQCSHRGNSVLNLLIDNSKTLLWSYGNLDALMEAVYTAAGKAGIRVTVSTLEDGEVSRAHRPWPHGATARAMSLAELTDSSGALKMATPNTHTVIVTDGMSSCWTDGTMTQMLQRSEGPKENRGQITVGQVLGRARTDKTYAHFSDVTGFSKDSFPPGVVLVPMVCLDDPEWLKLDDDSITIFSLGTTFRRSAVTQESLRCNLSVHAYELLTLLSLAPYVSQNLATRTMFEVIGSQKVDATNPDFVAHAIDTIGELGRAGAFRPVLADVSQHPRDVLFEIAPSFDATPDECAVLRRGLVGTNTRSETKWMLALAADVLSTHPAFQSPGSELVVALQNDMRWIAVGGGAPVPEFKPAGVPQPAAPVSSVPTAEI